MKQFIISNNYLISILVIFISYFINAMMDAIDHAKGASNLNEFWHVLKTLSYGIPFIWIATLSIATHSHSWWVNTILIVGSLPFLWLTWELTYSISRNQRIEKLDDRIHMKYMNWLFGRKEL